MIVKVQFDVSSDKSIELIADDVAVLLLKVVNGPRLAIRKRWTRMFIDKPH